MTSSRPYLIRAIYEWLVDNRLTPYLMVDATMADVAVPKQYIQGGKIVLNVSPQAVVALRMTNEAVQFDARFSGVVEHIYIPAMAVQAIYAFENGRGMVFSEEDDHGGDSGDPNSPAPNAPGKGKPNLKIVK